LIAFIFRHSKKPVPENKKTPNQGRGLIQGGGEAIAKVIKLYELLERKSKIINRG